jgi:microcystin degradation protein MlrC
MVMRVAVLGFHHESNTFAPVPASLDQFMAAGLVEGDQLVADYAESHATLAGFIEACRDADDIDMHALVYADLNPMGTITEEAFEMIVGRMMDRLRDNGPWDAVLLALHGAAVAEHIRDVDGEILERTRALVGPEVTIGVTFDMHANVSARMVEIPDVVNTYMTNPHLDARLRAVQTAELTFRAVRGEIHPVARHASPPLIVNILRQGTSDSPMRELVSRALAAQDLPGVLSVSVAEGFPYADVEEMGMSFLAVTDGDPDLAAAIARDLADAAWAVRADLQGDGVAIDDALRTANASEQRPVVLLDVGDNVGGGSPADSTHVLSAAKRLEIGELFHSLCDPDAVDHCHAAGIGARVSLEVGGKTDRLHGDPVAVVGRIDHLDDGRFEEPTATHGGKRFFDVGPRAVLVTDDGYTLLLTSRPLGNTSLQELRSAGIEPLAMRIIVAKGVQSPRGAYEPIAAKMIQLDSPGCTSAVVADLRYAHRRRPMYPYEADTTY